MKCAVRNCTAPAYITDPLPMCHADALRVTGAFTTKALDDMEHRQATRQQPAEDETKALMELIDVEGWNAIDLNRAMEVLNRPKATAARRLSAARKRYAAELTRRARRHP